MTISATSVKFDDLAMWVDLTDGRTLGVPLAWFPRLLSATPAQRADVEISRVGLHWDSIDEDISIEGLVAGRPDVSAHPSSLMEPLTPTPQNQRPEKYTASSSAILSVVYEEPTQTLEVLFSSGRRYTYSDVPAEIYQQFVDASSKGAFFNSFVRDKFPFQSQSVLVVPLSVAAGA